MEPSITSIAIDDEPKALEIIERYVGKVSFMKLLHAFRDPLDAMDWLSDSSVDVLFLDINMPHLSGLAFRDLIGREPLIIFTTAYAEYALESYEHRALDYLLKPISFDRFFSAALKAKDYLEKRPSPIHQPPTVGQQLFIKSGQKRYKLSPADVLFCEKDGNYCIVHTVEKKILSRLTMTQLLTLLPEESFLRVHKSFVVNLTHVSIIEPHQLTIGASQIPIAKSYRDIVKNRLGHE
ncbi:MAG: LytTR family DNA-binding domain-containing protein [Bacteroidota bacterium]